MAGRRQKVGVVATLMEQVIAGMELEDSPLLPVIRQAQQEEVTHLCLVIRGERGKRVYLLTAGHLLNLELLKDFRSLVDLPRHSPAQFDEHGLAGKPLAALSRRERTKLLRAHPELQAEEFATLCATAPMCHFSLVELSRLAFEMERNRTDAEFLNISSRWFPDEEHGYWETWQPRGLPRSSVRKRRSGLEHGFYERRLKGVLVEI